MQLCRCKQLGVADERSELGACYQGVPQNDLGMRTDVLDGCPKSEGMLMLIRSMAPAVVAVDGIGGKEDIKAVEYVRNCGCALAATAHGSSLEELKKEPVFRNFWEKTFERLVFLMQKRNAEEKWKWFMTVVLTGCIPGEHFNRKEDFYVS